MTVEYLILGIVLMIMGAVQIWLRHGPGSKEARRPADDPQDGGDAGLEVKVSPGGGRIRSGRAWDAWTAILGFVGIGLGIALVVIGALGK
jgi:hypothetical protein